MPTQNTTPTPVMEGAHDTHPVTALGGRLHLFDGSFHLSYELLRLFDGQTVALTLSYSSRDTMTGAIAPGWHHNFEKRVERINTHTVHVYTSPSTYSVFVSMDPNAQGFFSEQPDKYEFYYLYVLSSNDAYAYQLDCGGMRTEYYLSDGRLGKIVDHEGRAITLSYTQTVTTVTDALTGRSLYLHHDTNGRLLRVTDAAERQATLSYKPNGELLGFTNPGGATAAFIYISDRLFTCTDWRGITQFTLTYDADGRVSACRDAITPSSAMYITYTDTAEACTRTLTDRLGKSSTLVFRPDGMLTSHTDPCGGTTTYAYDERLNTTHVTDARGKTTVSTYNHLNLRTSFTDARGKTTTYAYDPYRNLTSVTYPAMDEIIPTESFTYDTSNRMTSHTDRRGTVTVYTYDEAGMPSSRKVGDRPATTYVYEGGRLMRTTDPCGATTHYTYTAHGQIETVTDPMQGVTRYTYDPCGRTLSVTDPMQGVTSYTYDGEGRVLTVKDAKGRTTATAYRADGSVSTVTYPDSTVQSYTYDAEGRVTVESLRDGRKITRVYDDCGRCISATVPSTGSTEGAKTAYTYDACGNLTKEVSPLGAVTTRVYDACGNTTALTDHAGATTYTNYDAEGRVTLIERPGTCFSRFVYAAGGELLRATDPRGRVTTHTYDAYGNRLSTTDARGYTTTYTYDACDRPLTVTDPLEGVTTTVYDKLGRVTSVTDPCGGTTSYTYDKCGRRTAVTDARGNTTTYTYDACGNVLTVTDPLNGTTTNVYDSCDRVTSVTDPLGKQTTYTYTTDRLSTVTDALSRRKTLSYDARGNNSSVAHRLTTQTAADTTAAAHDATGNVTSRTGALGGSTTYTYDAMGRITQGSTPSGGTVSYEYNEFGKLSRFVNGRGQTTTYIYYPDERLGSVFSPEGTASYTYDACGNLVSVQDAVGTVTRTFDACGRMTSYTDTNGQTVGYAYDACGRLTRLTYPDGTAVTYTYDACGNLATLTDWNDRTVRFTYDKNGRLTTMSRHDYSFAEYTYNAKGQLIKLRDQNAYNDLMAYGEYTYDAVGNLVEEKDLAKSQKVCYTYDKHNRVTSRVIKNLSDVVQSTESFTYDAQGNVLTAPNASFSYDTNNRLSMLFGEVPQHDAEGNITSTYCNYYTYDSKGHVTYCMDMNSTYVYDAEGLRSRATFGSTTTYTYDTSTPLPRLLTKTEGGVTTKYLWGVGLYAEEVGGALYFHHFDYRGSSVCISGTDGNPKRTRSYKTYGASNGSSGTYNSIFGFCGRLGVMTDPDGHLYMRARYYRPDWYRFLTPDTLHGSIRHQMSLNRYAYACDNPVTLVDPSGHAAVAVGLSTHGNGEYVGVTRGAVSKPTTSSGWNPDDPYGLLQTPAPVTVKSIKQRRKEAQAALELAIMQAYLQAYLNEQAEIMGAAGKAIDVLTFAHSFDEGVQSLSAGFKIVSKDGYMHIHGSEAYLESVDMNAKIRRVKQSNLDKFPEIDAHVSFGTTFKNSFADSFKINSAVDALGVVGDVLSIGSEAVISVNSYEDLDDKALILGYEIASGVASSVISSAASAGVIALVTKIGAIAGSFIPGLGTIVGAAVGFGVSLFAGWAFNAFQNAYVDPFLRNN